MQLCFIVKAALRLMLVSSSMIVASLQKTERVETDPRTAPASRRQRRACRCWSCWRGKPGTCWAAQRSDFGKELIFLHVAVAVAKKNGVAVKKSFMSRTQAFALKTACLVIFWCPVHYYYYYLGDLWMGIIKELTASASFELMISWRARTESAWIRF